MHLGIDFGANMAGTSCITFKDSSELVILQSQKKKSADDFIFNHIQELQAKQIFIDATLSLPYAYFGKGQNFHFRKCDSEMGAMSPMFLGGLTARAMKLVSRLPQHDFYEVYPSQFYKMVLEIAAPKKLKLYQEKTIKEAIFSILKTFGIKSMPKVENDHQLDSVVAWITGARFQKDEHMTFGVEGEGLIFI